MKRICYIVAVLLALTWATGFFALRMGGGVHVFLLMAMIAWLHAIITCPGETKKYILKKMEESETGEVEKSIFRRQRA